MNFKFSHSNILSAENFIENWGLKFGILILFVIWISSFGFSEAQQPPEFMLTWKADSYVPSDYQGKALPIAGSKIEVSLELIENNRLADLSRHEIRWFINNDDPISGIGLKTINFNADGVYGDQRVKVVIKQYKKTDLDEIIAIPLASPEIVIDSPYSNNRLTAGPAIFRALLFFFNFNNPGQTNLIWSANGIKTKGFTQNPDIINMDTTGLPSNTEISLEVTAQNTANLIEIAAKTINLTIK